MDVLLESFVSCRDSNRKTLSLIHQSASIGLRILQIASLVQFPQVLVDLQKFVAKTVAGGHNTIYDENIHSNFTENPYFGEGYFGSRRPAYLRKEKTKDVISEQDIVDALNRVLRVGELLASVIPPEELARYQSAPVSAEPRKPRKAQRTNKRQGN